MIREISSRPAITASPDTTAREAAHRMRSQRIGAVVVVNRRGAPLGIVTDRDITVRIVARGGDPSSVRLGAMLTRRPVVIRDDASMLDAARLLSRQRVRRLPVVDRTGALVGLVSLDDLLLRIGRELGHIASTLAGELGHRRPRGQALERR
jgi:CBS domain-containing protein